MIILLIAEDFVMLHAAALEVAVVRCCCCYLIPLHLAFPPKAALKFRLFQPATSASRHQRATYPNPAPPDVADDGPLRARLLAGYAPVFHH